VDEYESMTLARNTQALRREWGTGEVRITKVRFLDGSGRPASRARWGGPLTAEISYSAARRIDDPVFGFAVADSRGRLIYGSNTQIAGFGIPRIEGEGTVRLTIDALGMAAGMYLFSFSVHSSDHKVNYHRADNCFPIEVESDSRFEGVCHMPCRWGIG